MLRSVITHRSDLITSDDNIVKSFALLDLAASIEFSLSPEILQLDYTANSTTSNLPMLNVTFVNGMGHYTPLFIAFTENETYECQHRAMGIPSFKSS